MKKTIFALAAVATIVVGTLSAPTPADARWRGGGIGLGILGGVVAATIIGTAIANHDGYYRYDEYGDAPRGCYWARKAWRDPDGYVHYGRPRQFCD